MSYYAYVTMFLIIDSKLYMQAIIPFTQADFLLELLFALFGAFFYMASMVKIICPYIVVLDLSSVYIMSC